EPVEEEEGEDIPNPEEDLPDEDELAREMAEESGGQGGTHFSIVADATNPNLVYVGGDRQPLNNGANAGTFPNAIGANNFSGRLFRGDASQPSGSQWTPITNNFAAGTSPHADSRSMAFDAAGNLIETDD